MLIFYFTIFANPDKVLASLGITDVKAKSACTFLTKRTTAGIISSGMNYADGESKMPHSLYDKLTKYSRENICPMHMPGHKRKTGSFSGIDITEIDGFDNLGNPKGILKDISDRAARIYGAEIAFLSVNGSTGAILASVSAVCRRGDKVIMARNCHKSVYNAIELCGAKAEFIFPDYDESGIAKDIPPANLKSAIEENPDAKLIILTSPTYEGVISDIKSICEIAHGCGIPVMVDAAHGAHLRFMGQKDAIDCGADIAVMSLHKTLPSLTQTAVLCLNGKLIDSKKVAAKMNVFQSSSPSYILMASIDDCLRFIESKKTEFSKYTERLDRFYKKTENLKHLKIKRSGGFLFDRGKIVILADNADISGRELMEKFRREFKIEPEMAYNNYCIAMTSVCDETADFERLLEAILKTDDSLTSVKKFFIPYPKPEKAAELSGTEETELIKISDSKGRICADYIWAYPPGVPIIAPGERISADAVYYMENLKDTYPEGQTGQAVGKILVLKV